MVQRRYYMHQYLYMHLFVKFIYNIDNIQIFYRRAIKNNKRNFVFNNADACKCIKHYRMYKK